MKFKGGPDDKKYKQKVMALCKERPNVSAFKEALKKKVGLYLELNAKKEMDAKKMKEERELAEIKAQTKISKYQKLLYAELAEANE